MSTFTTLECIGLFIDKFAADQFAQIFELKCIILSDLEIELVVSIGQDVDAGENAVQEELSLYSDDILSHESELLVADDSLSPGFAV